MLRWYVLGKLCERNTCSGTATVQFVNGTLPLVAFTGASKQHGELEAGEEKV